MSVEIHVHGDARMRYCLRAQRGALVTLVGDGDGVAEGVAACPCCNGSAAVHRGELLCLHCGCRHVPDRSVRAHGPYHDGIAWTRVDGPRLRIEGFA